MQRVTSCWMCVPLSPPPKMAEECRIHTLQRAAALASLLFGLFDIFGIFQRVVIAGFQLILSSKALGHEGGPLDKTLRDHSDAAGIADQQLHNGRLNLKELLLGRVHFLAATVEPRREVSFWILTLHQPHRVTNHKLFYTASKRKTSNHKFVQFTISITLNTNRLYLSMHACFGIYLYSRGTHHGNLLKLLCFLTYFIPCACMWKCISQN